MALNANQLAQELKISIENRFSIVSEDILDDFCQCVAESIVNHITSNAVVNGTVTSGAGAGGNVIGDVT